MQSRCSTPTLRLPPQSAARRLTARGHAGYNGWCDAALRLHPDVTPRSLCAISAAVVVSVIATVILKGTSRAGKRAVVEIQLLFFLSISPLSHAIPFTCLPTCACLPAPFSFSAQGKCELNQTQGNNGTRQWRWACLLYNKLAATKFNFLLLQLLSNLVIPITSASHLYHIRIRILPIASPPSFYGTARRRRQPDSDIKRNGQPRSSVD